MLKYIKLSFLHVSTFWVTLGDALLIAEFMQISPESSFGYLFSKCSNLGERSHHSMKDFMSRF